MKQLLFAVLALAVVVLSALANAASLDRWGLTGEPEASVEKLKHVSHKVGDWVGKDKAVDLEQLRIAGGEGHVIRVYTHSFIPAKEVTIMLLCGKARPIAFHPPEVCYSGAGYKMEGDHRPTLKIEDSEFFAAMFSKEQAVVTDRLKICWAWARGGKQGKGIWVATVRPRSEFRAAHALYKLYVIRPCAEGEDLLARDASLEFLEVFLPELRKKLVTSS